ncbi:MAG: glycosyltransferase family 2 protein [Syntrophomonadaceae bacterium]|nr:glycosyltransferase family 2 protein [Brevefilum fermentans]
MIFSKLGIVIVNYSQVNDTIECINSLLMAGALLSQIIIVDNCSIDNSVEILKEQYDSSLTILELDENKGYPHGLNQGIPNALKKGAEWLLLMNNDVVVDKDFIKELNSATQDQPEAQLIGPAILYYDHPEIIWYIGYKLIPGTLIGVRSYRGRKYNANIPKYLSIDVMHGCTMMVNKKVFIEIGYFDDSSLIYGDDADFSWRARKAGFKMIAATRAKMWHKISLTMGELKPRTRYLRTRNTIKFYKKYSHGLSLPVMFLFTIAKGFLTLIKDLCGRNCYLVRPLFWGIVDGWGSSQKGAHLF